MFLTDRKREGFTPLLVEIADEITVILKKNETKIF